MRELAIAGVWLVVAVGLFMIESDVHGDFFPYVVRGKWIALVLAGMNALRPVVKRSGIWFFRRIGWISTPAETVVEEVPPRPVVHPEFQFTDDRPPNPPPESNRP